MLIEDLAEEMALEVGEPFSDVDVEAQYLRWTEEVFADIALAGRWFTGNGEETVTLVDATRLYDVAADVVEISVVFDGVNARGIAYSDLDALVRNRKNPKASCTSLSLDAPSHWYWGGWNFTSHKPQIAFYPVPDTTSIATVGTLDLYTSLSPPALAKGDTIPYPADFIDVARKGIRDRIYSNSGQVQLAAKERQAFIDGLSILAARFGGKPSKGSRLPAKARPGSRRQGAVADPGYDPQVNA